MAITTNNVPRPLLYWFDLTPEERAKFDWEGVEDDNFFRYRHRVYCMDEFLATEEKGELRALGWDGHAADSYFTATLVRLVDGGESVIVGRLCN